MEIKKGFNTKLTCPNCQSEYIHTLGRVEQVIGMDRSLAWSGRGDAIKIPIWCEHCNCATKIIIGEHKGNMFLTYE